MEILLVQTDHDIREKVKFLIESTFRAHVNDIASLPEAAPLMKNRERAIDLVILDVRKGKVEEINSFLKLIKDIPVLVSEKEVNNANMKQANIAGTFDPSVFPDGIVVVIEDLLKRLVFKSETSTAAQEQVRIRTKLLLAVAPLKGDIYIRLSDSKFVKLFREGDVFDLNDLEKYTVKKGVEYLYIRREQCYEFARKYCEEIRKATTVLTPEENAKQDVAMHETVTELIRHVGYSPEIQQLAKTQVEHAVKEMSRDSNLAKVLQRVSSFEGQYLSSHSVLCAHIACALASRVQWKSDTTFTKLTLASYLHDVTLDNRMASIASLEEMKKEKGAFTDAEIEIYKNHPIAAAELARGMSEVPPDVDIIIQQHHERADGKGFPKSMAHSYISPLSTVFIIAHELSHEISLKKDQFKFDEFLSKMKSEYSVGQFKKILAHLEEMRAPGM